MMGGRGVGRSRKKSCKVGHFFFFFSLSRVRVGFSGTFDVILSPI